MAVQRLTDKMVARANEVKIDFKQVKTSRTGNHYYDISFKNNKKVYRFCAKFLIQKEFLLRKIVGSVVHTTKKLAIMMKT